MIELSLAEKGLDEALGRDIKRITDANMDIVVDFIDDHPQYDTLEDFFRFLNASWALHCMLN